MDGSRLADLGWRPKTGFADGLAATIDWFVANEAWWRTARSGDWDAYYERQYGARLAGAEASAAESTATESTAASDRPRG